MKRERVFVHAYTFTNLGDDLFVRLLCDRYPDTTFWIACLPRQAAGLRRIDNLRVFPVIPWVDGLLRKLGSTWSINTEWQRLLAMHCKATVTIGGSMFIQSDRWQHKAAQYRRRILKGQPFFLLGSNFGPYQDPRFLAIYRDLIKQAHDACFRDKASYQIFADLMPSRYAPDILFTLAASPMRQAGQGSRQSRKPGNRLVVFSDIDLAGRPDLATYQEAYQNGLLELVRCCHRQGYRTVLMGFCAIEGDGKAAKAIYDRLPDDEKSKSACYLYIGDIAEALSIIAGAELIVATRFHAMILGWVYGKKVWPVLYSEKSLNVIEDIGYAGPMIRVQDFDRLAQVDLQSQLTAFLQAETGRGLEQLNVDIDSQATMAEQQFMRLDELLMMQPAQQTRLVNPDKRNSDEE